MPEGLEDKIEEPDLTHTLSPSERSLRDRFVKEYLVDYNSTAAACRVGYRKSIAAEFGVRFMQEPYTLQQIRLAECEPLDSSPEAAKQRVMTGLIREANYRGPGSSQAARIAALSKLASIYGMDAPTRSQQEITGPDGQPLKGGYFVVPGIMTVEDWEKQALEQQSKLVAQPPIGSN
jgi:hypothetical protein